MDVAPNPPGAPDESATAVTSRTTRPSVFSALLRGLSEADAEFVTGAMQRARQATKDADDRGETGPGLVW